MNHANAYCHSTPLPESQRIDGLFRTKSSLANPDNNVSASLPPGVGGAVGFPHICELYIRRHISRPDVTPCYHTVTVLDTLVLDN